MLNEEMMLLLFCVVLIRAGASGPAGPVLAGPIFH